MKTNILSKVVLGAFLSIAFAACTEEAYVPAPQEDASKTYVRADETASRNLDIDGADILVPFVRTNTSGALDVTVALTDTSGLFSLKNTTVSFAAGEATATAAVSYSYDALDPEAEYSIVVSLTSGDVSEYSAKALPLTCKKAWQNLGMAQYCDTWWYEDENGLFVTEKQLIKAPDGTETYRLLNPYDKATVERIGKEFVNEIPYLEFVINEDGSISYASMINLGFRMQGMTLHLLHPAARKDEASVAKNKMVMENVAQFVWYPILNYNNGSFSWWGVTSLAYISFPGGPDLAELLEL